MIFIKSKHNMIKVVCALACVMTLLLKHATLRVLTAYLKGNSVFHSFFFLFFPVVTVHLQKCVLLSLTLR